MFAFETAAARPAFADSAAAGALSTHLLADLGLVEPVDLMRVQARRRAIGEAHRLGVNAR